MKRVFLLLLIIPYFIACGDKEKSPEASQNQEISDPTLDSAEKIVSTSDSDEKINLAGTYSGVLPCEGCDGLDVMLVINEDQTFQQNIRYINSEERSEKKQKGSYSWSNNKEVIKLEGVEGISEFKVEELYLLPLDANGDVLKPVPGNNFQLLKQ